VLRLGGFRPHRERSGFSALGWGVVRQSQTGGTRARHNPRRRFEDMGQGKRPGNLRALLRNRQQQNCPAKFVLDL